MMTPQKRHWLAGSLGTGLVLLLVLLAGLDTLGDLDAPERFVLTEVTTYEAPPPPPPPPPRPSNARSGGSTGTLWAMESTRTPVSLDVMQLNVRTQPGELNLGGLGAGIGVGSGDGTGDGNGTGFGLGLAGLSELDQLPTVVSAPVFPYPDEATAREIAEFDLRFHILIDEEGRTYPITMVESPFPALSNEFLEWASKVRFSPPTRLGIPVRTEYVWPVKIKR